MMRRKKIVILQPQDFTNTPKKRMKLYNAVTYAKKCET